jgi:ketosteroid isomerase-like protein
VSDAHGSEAMLVLAARFFDAVAAGDIDTVRAIYAPDALIWHNYDGKTQDAETNLRTLAVVARVIRGLRYEDVRRTVTSSGFVQQHVLRGIAPNGAELNVPACIVCTVVEGRITRLDEYFDSAHLAPLLSQA